MSGQPPVVPPTLSYKSKAEREKEERDQREREREEAERLEGERLEKERFAAQEASKAAARAAPATPLALTATPPPAMETGMLRQPPPPPRPGDAAMFEEDAKGPGLEAIDDIQMLGAPEEEYEAEEVAGEEEVLEVKRTPPRPPKSPDTRPVYVGFILVFTGLTQFIWGVLAMWNSPDAGSGIWSPLLKWGAFGMGFIAAFLGLLAIRGGLWSFRKERFDVVMVGAISASVCIWAAWIPWLFGVLALLIVRKARHEYYPNYNPAWDAPSWTRPAVTPEADQLTDMGIDVEYKEQAGEVDTLDGDGLDWDEPAPGDEGDPLPG